MPIRQRQRRFARGAVELLEEAAHLLRLAPPDVHLWYYLGAFPFVLGLLFFWSDMSRNGLAGGHLALASFGLAVLFWWMKCCQAVFARRLKGRLIAVPLPPWTAARATRMAVLQASVVPWGGLLLPLALLLTLPFGWCFAFFQNLTVLDPGEEGPLRTSVARAWHQARLWPAQNHLLLLILSLFAFFVFFSLAATAYLLPHLLKTLFGVDTLFARSNLFLLNTTFWSIVLGLTWLFVDPLVKAVYVLRCFYGESLRTGEDLLTELRRMTRPAGRTLTLLALAALLFLPAARPAAAGIDPGLPAREQIAPDRLESAITAEIESLEYAWRLPRERPEEEEGPPGFLDEVLEMLAGWGRWLGEKVEDFFEWLARWWPKFSPSESSGRKSARQWGGAEYLWLYLLLALVASGTGLFLYRHFRRGKEPPAEAPPADPVATPDLEADEVSAEELPADRWRALARDLMARGQTRLGLRALALGDLAQLAGASLLTLARTKSNRDYQRELARRAHHRPTLLAAFSQNLLLLERVWFGMHEADAEMVETFLTNHRRIASLGREE